MKLNTLDHWPHVHLCVIDPWCLRCFWEYGSPLRLHYKDRYWEIPGLLWLANKRSRQVWDFDNPVRRFITIEKPEHDNAPPPE